MLPERNMRLGTRAEDAYRHHLTAERRAGRVRSFHRPEWIVYPASGSPFFVEVKGQHIYVPPPFYGHGLPLRQAMNYNLALEVTGMRTRLVVYDPAGYRYEGWIDELELGEYVDTPGTSTGRRRIYDIASFEAFELKVAA